MSEVKTISVQEFPRELQPGSVDVIDVRTPLEFREVRATHARNVPLDVLDPHTVLKARSGAEDDPVYLICKGGTRGAKACQKFIDAGFTNVINVGGGTDAWAAAGMPVVRSKKAVSLERQVRITAGFIVFAGAVAALATGNVYFAGIPAFVGAGLMFAGITNSCAMGMVIAKMPWNRVSGESCSV